MIEPLTESEIEAAGDRIGSELVSEAQGVRIWHLRLAPGETLPAHRHDRPYFWTVLTDGRARSRDGDGGIREVSYQAGETRHFPDLSPAKAFVHDLSNIGETDLVFVTIEFRDRTTGHQTRNG
ncbi:hypothetical protein [Roseibium sediminicola]|uniref:Cupin domain-containing protein n=1 Tax=Roseibium sediminicola TaxID=2933272 RepID=A0ABT0GUR5_9HYPH|nr:hypothetical protein [Roseibium sp. CAU 1639]MCK7613046.1 hypothetical protein [Roseibium sp. CAU 1639]